METKSSFDVKWFKRQLETNDISQRRLAELLGVDPPKISLSLQGKRQFTHGEVARLAEIFRISVDDVMSHMGVKVAPVAKKAPIVAVIAKSGELLRRETRAKADMPEKLSGNTVAERCEDPEALFFGWTIFYVPANEIDPDAIGRLSIATTVDGKTIMAVVRRGIEPGNHHLVQLDGPAFDARLTAAVPVLWVKP